MKHLRKSVRKLGCLISLLICTDKMEALGLHAETSVIRKDSLPSIMFWQNKRVLYVFLPWFLIYFSFFFFFSHMVRKIRLLSTLQQKRTKNRTEQLEGTFKDHLVQPPDHFRTGPKIYQLFKNLKKQWNAALTTHSKCIC